ncbi:hypothetical protein JCM14469_26750 [Desulfatiferula olefinivorans]
MNEKLLIGEREAAHMTGRAVQTLRNDRHRSQGLPYCKIGRRVLYSVEDIRAFIETHKITPAN